MTILILWKDRYFEQDGQHFYSGFLSYMGGAHGGGGCTMMSKKPGIAHIMKYVVFMLIVVFVVLLMLFASGSNKSFDEVRQGGGRLP